MGSVKYDATATEASNNTDLIVFSGEIPELTELKKGTAVLLQI